MKPLWERSRDELIAIIEKQAKELEHYEEDCDRCERLERKAWDKVLQLKSQLQQAEEVMNKACYLLHHGVGVVGSPVLELLDETLSHIQGKEREQV